MNLSDLRALKSNQLYDSPYENTDKDNVTRPRNTTKPAQGVNTKPKTEPPMPPKGSSDKGQGLPPDSAYDFAGQESTDSPPAKSKTDTAAQSANTIGTVPTWAYLLGGAIGLYYFLK